MERNATGKPSCKREADSDKQVVPFFILPWVLVCFFFSFCWITFQAGSPVSICNSHGQPNQQGKGSKVSKCKCTAGTKTSVNFSIVVWDALGTLLMCMFYKTQSKAIGEGGQWLGGVFIFIVESVSGVCTRTFE